MATPLSFSIGTEDLKLSQLVDIITKLRDGRVPVPGTADVLLLEGDIVIAWDA